SRIYTATIGERSSLRRDIEAMRGKRFTGSESESFELASLLGKPCMLNLIHEVSKNGRKYHKIIGLTPLPKGTRAPAMISETLHYQIEDGENDVFEQLPEYIRGKIQASLEMTGEADESDEPDPAIIERNVREAAANAAAANATSTGPRPPVMKMRPRRPV